MPQYYPMESYEMKLEYKKKASLGFVSGLGFDWYLAKDLFVNIDVTYNHNSYTPLNAEVIEYTEMGEDALDELDVSQREIEFVDIYESTDNEDPDKPHKQLKTTYRMDHVLFRLGFKLLL
mgnify:CR=1 FL=1